jgi:hypothetical protein
VNQTFVLHGRPQWDRVVAFIKANVGGERLLGITVFDADEKKRSTQQNSFYWKARMEVIADQAWVNGRQFSKEAWHEYYAEKFCPRKELTLPTGEIKSVRISTTDMKVAEFSAYIQQIEADAATELGIEFDA